MRHCSQMVKDGLSSILTLTNHKEAVIWQPGEKSEPQRIHHVIVVAAHMNSVTK